MASSTQYIFVFLGEFGFELLNWQGVVRKFAATLPTGDRIVCCSRAALWPLYEMADLYVDISDVRLFQQTQASGYSACLARPQNSRSADYEPLCPYSSLRGLAHERRVRAAVTAHITEFLQRRSSTDNSLKRLFVFSSIPTELNGCQFGPAGSRWRLTRVAASSLLRRLRRLHPAIVRPLERLRKPIGRLVPSLARRPRGSVYGALDVRNNVFKRIEPDLGCSRKVEGRLRWASTEPFILCQGRSRPVVNLSQDRLSRPKLVECLRLLSLVTGMRTVLLVFDTGRRNDSYSDLPEAPGSTVYRCDSFPEQAYLVHLAKHCVFFTEGDFGSHIYVPPLMGKTVTAVAPASVLKLQSAPIEFWNRHVFTLGGQVVPEDADAILRSEQCMRRFAERVAGRVQEEAVDFNPDPAGRGRSGEWTS